MRKLLTRLPRILIYTEAQSPTFALVAQGPFDALAAQGDCAVRYLWPGQIARVMLLAWCDTLFMVRPRSRWSVRLAWLAHRLGRQVIVYWDDDLFTFPQAHPDAPNPYVSPQVKRNMRRTIELADVVAVANPRVTAAFRSRGLLVAHSAVLGVPALGVDLTAPVPPTPERATPMIGFAGHPWYAALLEQIIVPALVQLRRDGIAFHWEIAGPNPALPPELAAVTTHFERMRYEEWTAFRNAHLWDVGLAVLPDGPYFACKFYNKFIEYSAAGVPAIYSNVAPYMDAIEHGVNGWLTDNTVAAWAAAIRTLLTDPALRLRLRTAAWAKLTAEHSLDAVLVSYRTELHTALARRCHMAASPDTQKHEGWGQRMIPVFRPAMGQAEIDAIAEVIRSGWIGLGPRTAAFEASFARMCETTYAVGVNSATAALDLALKLLGIGPGDEVLVPAITFVSTAHVVMYNQATPIFVDVDPRTVNMDMADVVRRITPRTRAIIPVHYAGRPVDLDALAAVTDSIPIVEDCAHAAGARYAGRAVGGFGAVGCFSFHAVKNLACGDGGALVMNDPAFYQRALRLRWLGIDRSTWDRTVLDQAYWWRYQVEEIGMKCHMNDLMASIAAVQLEKLARTNARRQEIVARYCRLLANIDQVELPPADDAVYQSAWHLFHIKCERRNELSQFLAAHGIATSVHYIPLHTYDCYTDHPHLPHAEALQHRLLTLPLFPDLTDEQVDFVCDCVRRFYAGETTTHVAE